MKVCKKCGSTERTSDNRCKPCRAEQKKRSDGKNREAILIRSKLRYELNKEEINARKKKRYHEDEEYRQKVLAQVKSYAEPRREDYRLNSIKWRVENPERSRSCSRNWANKNPMSVKAIRANAYARRSGLDEHKLTKEQLISMLETQNYECVYCGKDLRGGYHIDHRISISKGGNHALENLQCLCPSCNNKKYNKHPDDFAKEIQNLKGNTNV